MSWGCTYFTNKNSAWQLGLHFPLCLQKLVQGAAAPAETMAAPAKVHCSIKEKHIIPLAHEYSYVDKAAYETVHKTSPAMTAFKEATAGIKINVSGE